MSNDKTKEPLLSDEVLSQLNCRCKNCVRRVSAVMEASRKQDKDRIEELTGLVQELVDTLEGACSYARTFDECPYLDGENALSKAKQSGFTPNT